MNQLPQRIIQEIGKVIAGKEQVTRAIVRTVLADGHVLLDDMPGVGKTSLAMALSKAVGLSFRRVQFTPDVMPSDLVGYSVYDRPSDTLRYHPGVLNDANLLLGDEINRTASKTQSALLEAMEERRVTVDGETHTLPSPFLVIATQNNAGSAGTQPLPHAQLDRFMVRLTVGAPGHQALMDLLRARQDADPMAAVRCVATREELMRMQAEVRAVRSNDAVLDYIARLTLASGEEARLSAGISPRGALFLDRSAKAHAYLDGRDYVTGSDVQAVFAEVCAHRVVMDRRAAAAGCTPGDILRSLLETVENPDRRG